MVGAQYVPPTGVWNEGRGIVGKVIGYMNDLFYMASLEQPYHESKTFIPVECIDGLLMATQYDVPWREDLFDGFDFMMYPNHLNLKSRIYSRCTCTARCLVYPLSF